MVIITMPYIFVCKINPLLHDLIHFYILSEYLTMVLGGKAVYCVRRLHYRNKRLKVLECLVGGECSSSEKISKKIMKKYVILYLILLAVKNLPSQNIQVDTNAIFVIANGGLNLRIEPKASSTKLLTIPFGSTIKYLSNNSFNIDSISVYHSDNPEKEIITGNWVKIEYKKVIGYVLDIYLSWKPKGNDRFYEKYDTDFILLYPGCGCNAENIHNPNKWKWFGYFKKGEGTYEIEEIKISFYRTRIYTCDLIVSASKNENLSFIIGSKFKNLSSKKIAKGTTLLFRAFDRENKIKKSSLDSISIELVENKDNKTSKPSELYLKSGNQKQLLNKPEYDYPYEIKFAGDLDGDLKDDYIIHYGDKGGVIVLYLTSKAKSGNLIKKVAIFFASYCC